MTNGRHPRIRAALSLLVALAMVLGGVPAPALAEAASGVTASVGEAGQTEVAPGGAGQVQADDARGGSPQVEAPKPGDPVEPDAAGDGKPDPRVADAPRPKEGLVYDGTERAGVEAGEGYVLEGDKATDAGDHTATATLSEGWEWADGTTEAKAVEWTIARRPVTVTADDKSKLAGEADPELTATVEGTLGDDTVSYTLSRAEGEAAGEYAITPTGDAEQGNYAVTFVPGRLTVGEAPKAEKGDPGKAGDVALTTRESRSESTLAAQADGDIVASGVWGTCPWEIDAAGALTVYPGAAGTDRPWSDYRQYVTSVRMVEQGGNKVVLPSNCSGLFYNCTAITTMDLSGADTSSVTRMGLPYDSSSGMFSNCRSLTSLDLSGWDTQRVARMSFMFYSCRSLTSLDLSGWDTSSVTDMSFMFNSCDSLTSLDLSGWDTSSVTDMSDMFYSCDSLTSLDLSGWDTSKVASMRYMFYSCRSLSSLDLSGWDTSEVTDSNSMLDDCSGLARLVLGEGFTLHSAVPTYTVNGVSGWYSEGLQRLLTPLEFVARKGVADTYTKRPVDGDVDISSAAVTLSATSFAFDGTAKEPVPTVKLGGTTLKKGNDYGVTYSDNVHVGTATVTVQGWGTYRGTVTATFQIVGDVANARVAPIPKQTFTGSALEPTLTVTLDGRTLVPGIDYDVSYASNVNAGTATATITGKGVCEGTKTVEFTVARKAVTVIADDKDKVFGEDDPALTATVDGLVGGDTVSYSLSREAGDAYGEYAITPTGDAVQGNYAVTYVPGKLTIGKASVANAEVTPIAGQTYTGNVVEPRPEVKYQGKTLVIGTDYELSYESNVNAGSATVTIIGMGDYAGTKSVGFTILRKPVDAPEPAEGLVYDGTEQEGVPSGEGYSLAGDTARTNVGIYKATATLDSNHAWKDGTLLLRDVMWTIAARAVTVSGREVSKEYGEDDPELVAVDGLVAGDSVEYDVVREPGEALGEYAVTPTGEASQGNYAVTYVPGKLTITKADISGAVVSPIEGQMHTGGAIEPEPTVTLRGRELVLGTDYGLSYEDNVEPGTATVTITGRGNYTGAKSVEFSVGTRWLSDAYLVLDGTLFPASAAPVRPSVSGRYTTGSGSTYASEELEEGRDFAVSYVGGDGVGEGNAVVRGMGDYAGTVELAFEVVDRVDISDSRARALFWPLGDDDTFCTSFVYHGQPVRPTVVMGPGPLVRGDMVEGRDFEVSYLACDGPGNALAVVTGIGDYKGEKSLSYTIVDPHRISLEGASTTLANPIAWLSHPTIGEHFATYLRVDGREPMPVPTVTVNGARLEEGVDYEFGYEYAHYSESNPGERDMGLCIIRGLNGVSGEAYQAFYVVDEADVAWLHLGMWDLQQQEYRWEGEPVRPKLLPREDFVEGRDYHLSYRGNDRVGTCVVTVTGIGRFYGSAEIEVPVVEELSFTPYSECEIEVVEPEGGFVYDGSEKRPEVRVTDPKTGQELVKNANYSVSYADNVGAGTATARISSGIVTAGYGGYAEATFEIAKAPSGLSARAIEGSVAYAYGASGDVCVMRSNVAVTGASGPMIRS